MSACGIPAPAISDRLGKPSAFPNRGPSASACWPEVCVLPSFNLLSPELPADCARLARQTALRGYAAPAPVTLAASTFTPTPWVELSEILFK
jgi:hypothetical protein